MEVEEISDKWFWKQNFTDWIVTEIVQLINVLLTMMPQIMTAIIISEHHLEKYANYRAKEKNSTSTSSLHSTVTYA